MTGGPRIGVTSIVEGKDVAVKGQRWPAVFPGLTIVITVLAVHTIGEGLVNLGA